MDLDKLAAASEGRRARLLLQPEQPDGHLHRRDGDARLLREGQPRVARARRSWSTRRTSTTSPIRITTRTFRWPSRTRGSSWRARSRRRSGWPACGSATRSAHPDTIKKMADWDGGSGTSSLNVLALHAGMAAHRRRTRASTAIERARNKEVRDFTMKWFADRGHEAGRLAGQLHVREHRPRR